MCVKLPRTESASSQQNSLVLSPYLEFARTVSRIWLTLSTILNREIENCQQLKTVFRPSKFSNTSWTGELRRGDRCDLLSWLPIQEDDEESVHIYGSFLDLVENNNVYVLGDNNANLPDIIKIWPRESSIGQIKSDDHPELMARIQAFCAAQKNEAVWSAILAKLPELIKFCWRANNRNFGELLVLNNLQNSSRRLISGNL